MDITTKTNTQILPPSALTHPAHPAKHGRPIPMTPVRSLTTPTMI